MTAISRPRHVLFALLLAVLFQLFATTTTAQARYIDSRAEVRGTSSYSYDCLAHNAYLACTRTGWRRTDGSVRGSTCYRYSVKQEALDGARRRGLRYVIQGVPIPYGLGYAACRSRSVSGRSADHGAVELGIVELPFEAVTGDAAAGEVAMAPAEEVVAAADPLPVKPGGYFLDDMVL